MIGGLIAGRAPDSTGSRDGSNEVVIAMTTKVDLIILDIMLPLASKRGGREDSEGSQLRFSRFPLDRDARELLDGAGQPVARSPKEDGLLEFPASHAGKAVEPGDDYECGLGAQRNRERAYSIDRFVTNLRKKVEFEPGNPKHILTVRGFGCKFDGVATAAGGS